MPYSPSASRRVGRAMAWGVALTVGAVVFRELVRPRGERARLIDWERVEALALNRCGEAQDPPADPALSETYRKIAAELTPVLVQTLGDAQAPAGTIYPPLTPVGRRQWVHFNIRIFRQMFAPVERLETLMPGSLLLGLGRRGMTQYLGLMLGLLSRRVLGQYDPALLGQEPVETTSLVLVESNVQAWASKDGLPLDELRRWLAMHEMTHAWEFRGHPWLQRHLEELLRGVLVGRLMDGHRPTALELLRTLTVGMGQQWQAISRLQAIMSLLEGYSNVIMDEVGRRQLPHFAELEAAYHRRQQQRTPVERTFLRLTGLEMKLRQYVQGERFCRAVLEAGGPELLQRVWTGPEQLPTLEEIQDPDRWIARSRQPA